MKKFFKNAYVIAGIIVFVLVFGIGMWLGFSLGEAALGSAAIAVIGVGSIWWRQEIW
jgi:hypothetical protein